MHTNIFNPKIQDTEVEGFCDICIKYIVISHTLNITLFSFFLKPCILFNIVKSTFDTQIIYFV